MIEEAAAETAEQQQASELTDGDRLSLGVAARLSRYLQVLTQAKKMGKSTISSQELSDYTHINSTQIRRDLSGFGKFGKRGVGYTVDSLVKEIRKILRTSGQHNIALFGAGHLGQAIASSDIFADHGFRIVAIFDVDPKLVGKDFADVPVRSFDDLEQVVTDEDVVVGGLAATGTHPWASYLDQRIIDTPHYNRLRDELRWVAQRNNSWSLHVHVGIRGADRAIAVCDHLRGILPTLLAVSANSPFLDGHDTGLHSVRTEIFTRVFPRCGVHEPFGTFDAYADFVDLLVRTNTVVEATQLWWSVRPHHTFGTVELRICDAQTRGEESVALAALIAACIAQAALDHDDGRLPRRFASVRW